MPIRYTDMDMTTSGAQDFVIRRRAPTIPQFAFILFIAILIALSLIAAVMDKTTLALILVLLTGIVGWYVMLILQRSRDMVLATEFQNALFASALGINNKFCLIIKRDGNIIYLDRSFQEMFPDFIKQSRRTIDMLLDHGKVSREESSKIFSAIERGVYDKVLFDIRSSDGRYYKIVMSVEPILRPSGFILLRGREFVEQRSAAESNGAKLPSPLNKSNITLFSYIMDSMNMGVYMTDPTGNLIYANPTLEHWLGYQEGEISARNLSLQDIIYQNSSRTDTIEPDDFEGEVTLQKKVGGTLKAFINQKVIRNEQQALMGCTALLHNVADAGANVKKKLW